MDAMATAFLYRGLFETQNICSKQKESSRSLIFSDFSMFSSSIYNSPISLIRQLGKERRIQNLTLKRLAYSRRGLNRVNMVWNAMAVNV